MSEENKENTTSDFIVDKVEDTIFETPEVKEDVKPIVEQKEDAPKVEQVTVTAPSYPVKEVQAVGPVANGAIGVTKVEKVEKKVVTPTKKNSSDDKVAIFSTKNVTWSEVGKVYRGYNIVTKEAADKWLTRDHVRIATPEEVAKEFGK